MVTSVRVRFTSDWACGTGLGELGEIDAAVRRDEQGYPMVPGKHFTGRMLDAVELAVHALDQAAPQQRPWAGWFARLFGRAPDGTRTGGEALFGFATARLTPEIRAAVPPERAHLLFATRRMTSIDDTTGQAATDHLREIEVAIAGLELDAPVVPSPQATATDADMLARLLAAGVALEPRIGRMTRRGLGRCELSLQGVPEPSPQVPESLPEEPPPLPEEPSPTPPPARSTEAGAEAADTPEAGAEAADTPEAAGCLRVRLDITLHGPVIVPAGTVGNVYRTEQQVPGRLLLPLVDRALRERQLDPAALLRAGRLQVHHARPLLGWRPTLPAPRSLRGHPATGHLPAERTNLLAGTRRRGGDREHGWVPEGSMTVRKVAAGATSHNAVDDQRQRPTEETGGVFTYEWLAPGQQFRGELRLWLGDPAQVDQDDLCRALSGPTRLGASKKDQYGAAELTATPEPHPPAPEAANEIAVWLTAPALLVDAAGVADPTLEGLRTTLADALDTPLEWVRGATGPMGFLASDRADAWHAGWQAPRTTQLVVAAGSVGLLRPARDAARPHAAALQRLEDYGIGLRRGEGFGAVRINDPRLHEADWDPPDGAAVVATGDRPAEASGLPTDVEADPKWVERVTAWWAAETVRPLVEEFALCERFRRDELGLQRLSSTQLGQLRAALGPRPEGIRDRIVELVKAVERVPARARHWGAYPDRPQSGVHVELAVAIRQAFYELPADDPPPWWAKLRRAALGGLGEAAQPLTTTGSIDATLTPSGRELWDQIVFDLLTRATHAELQTRGPDGGDVAPAEDAAAATGGDS